MSWQGPNHLSQAWPRDVVAAKGMQVQVNQTRDDALPYHVDRLRVGWDGKGSSSASCANYIFL